jgi:hypothetical protein
MGGGGRSFSYDDLRDVEKIAKEEIRKSEEQIKRNVFISFDSDDLDEVNLLRGQAKNENSDLDFSDFSLKEPFESENAEYIKRGICEKIDKVSVTVVYLTNESAKSKWVNWEIEESLKRGKGVIGVYKGDIPPSNLPRKFTEHGLKIVPWKHKELSDAIESAAKKRT